MNGTTKPQGRTRAELVAILKEDLRRWDELAVIWDELMPDEQQTLLDTARAMIAGKP